ncbi:hypothetical protein EW145_g260 [Phellinidium pouzarii]|uniref:Methyltransferase type 11 domain-containing protein n=1 Tax=Phellinidium pouzarii TaxID=167371 RepID=A0A4S4LJM5_9AGAM|nr:hypothetical protein EW145_g260 [Phellinidium pouzarii]
MSTTVADRRHCWKQSVRYSDGRLHASTERRIDMRMPIASLVLVRLGRPAPNDMSLFIVSLLRRRCWRLDFPANSAKYSVMSASQVHQLAKTGFGTGTNELYDRARPTYQSDVLSHIRKAAGAKQPVNIIEIGAGTGIFTRALLAHPEWQTSVGELKAIEPSEGMRDVFSRTVADPRVSVSEGTFDGTGVSDGWADLLVTAQAFHWCPDHKAALQEFARVLKPNGVVVLVWNLEDRERAGWVAQLRDVYEEFEQGSPQFRLGLWRKVFDEPSYADIFQPGEEAVFSFDITGTTESVVDRVCSKSYIAVLSEENKRVVKQKVKDVVERGDNKVWIDQAQGVFKYPYNTLSIHQLVLSRSSMTLSSVQYFFDKIMNLAFKLQSVRVLNQEAALDSWIERTRVSQRQYHDEISLSKIADLFCTLPTRDHTHSDAGALSAPLRPVHSLAFFHARSPEAQLGVDQTDTHFCPPAPVHAPEAAARVRISKIEKKGFEKSTPMVFVHQNIDYEQALEDGPLINEERIHVYLPRQARADKRGVHSGVYYLPHTYNMAWNSYQHLVKGLPRPEYTFSWTPTPTTLFRFSALTWNAHLIHLDPAYARNEEGYPERLVHGPLTALMLVEALFHSGYNGRIDNFVYRAHNPVLVGRQQYVRGARSASGDNATVWAEDDDGVVGMSGTVDLLD